MRLPALADDRALHGVGTTLCTHLVPPAALPVQPPGLEVVSGYIGRLRLDLAITSLTCSVTAEDVLVTVRPCSSGGGGSGAGAGAGAPPSLGAGAPAEAPVAGGPATFGIDEGVRLVAAGVETLLQRMNVSVARLSVRVEGAAGIGTAASIMVAAISYGAAPAQADEVGVPWGQDLEQ